MSPGRLLKKPGGGRRSGVVPIVEADFALQGAVGLEFGPSVAVDLGHFVGAAPGEGDAVTGSAGPDLAGDAAEDELARAVRLEQHVGGFDQLQALGSGARPNEGTAEALTARKSVRQFDPD